DTELAVRLWDVDLASGMQALVTRGVYRAVDGPGSALRARFEIAPNGYRWAAGHILKIEVTSNDAPYYQPSNISAVVAIASRTMPSAGRGQHGSPPAYVQYCHESMCRSAASRSALIVGRSSVAPNSDSRIASPFRAACASASLKVRSSPNGQLSGPSRLGGS